MVIDFFTTPDHAHWHFRIRRLLQLTTKEAAAVREEVTQLLAVGARSVYIDAADAATVDLSGINEIIHTGYLLRQAGVSFVFVYRRHSEVEKWVATTGLHQFVATAIVPQ